MNKHIDLLRLLEYANNNISEDVVNQQITEHLIDCPLCQRILRSHFYLLDNLDEIFEESHLLADAIPIINSESIEFVYEKSESVISEILKTLQQLPSDAKEISNEALIKIKDVLLNAFQLPGLFEMHLPVNVKPGYVFLGDNSISKEDHSDNTKGNEIVRLRFKAPADFEASAFKFEITNNVLYVIYEKNNFEDLIGKRLVLYTISKYQPIRHCTFSKEYKCALAKLTLEDDTLGNVNNDLEYPEGNKIFLIVIT